MKSSTEEYLHTRNRLQKKAMKIRLYKNKPTVHFWQQFIDAMAHYSVNHVSLCFTEMPLLLLRLHCVVTFVKFRSSYTAKKI